jgi:hypothetical protein
MIFTSTGNALLMTTWAFAQIDSGGGMIHHTSLGSSLATGTEFLAVDKNKSGLQPQKLQ